MAEDKKKDQMVCNCGMHACGCGMHGGCWFRVLRWFFALVILLIVFMLGIKMGELRGMLESGYGYRMMRGPYNEQGYPMMPYGQGAASSTVPNGQY